MADFASNLQICCLPLIIAGMLLGYGGGEYHRARAYTKNFCQVTKFDIDDSSCGENQNLNCYRPVWAVLYDKPDIDDKPVQGEIHFESLLSLPQANRQVDQYQVHQ